MKKPNINKLNPMQFLKMGPERDAIIENAPATPVKETKEYKANALAKELHPKKQYLKVRNVIERSNDVKSYILTADGEKGTKKLAYFSAGQYLSIELKVGEALLNRPYSISSTPKQALNGEYVLTIKRVDGGLATNYILDNWEVGTEVVASAPCGKFTYEPLRDAKTVIGIAGGSGITPFYSFAGAIADGTEDFDLILIYGARNESEILFKPEFEELCQRSSRIKTVYVLSEEENENYEHGFITAEIIKKYAPYGEFSIFMCGPQGMYNFVDKQIEELNLRRKFVRHELFGEYRNPNKDEDYPENVADRFKLTISIRNEKTAMVAYANDTILNTLEKNGVPAPSRCRSGECGFCRARLVSGEVYVPKSVDGRRKADFDYGYIHPCCTFPISNVEIDIPRP